MKSRFLLIGVLVLLSANSAFAHTRHGSGNDGHPYDHNNNDSQPTRSDDGSVPDCLGQNGQPMQENNEQVIRWKASTPNEYHARAFIVGVIAGTTLDRQTHLQLDVNLGSDPNPNNKADHIEVIYNKAFGNIPDYRPGLSISACGDYITATAQSGGYQPSPLGAILHWVHASDNPQSHPSGFIDINGVLYGQDIPAGGYNGNSDVVTDLTSAWFKLGAASL